MLRSRMMAKLLGMNRTVPVSMQTEITERRASRSVVPRVGLRQLLSIFPVHEPALVAIRREQLRELLRVTPRKQVFAVITVLLMGWELKAKVALPCPA